jgi:hypothetical protein
MSSSVLVNDTVRIKVKFVDVNPTTGEQQSVSPSSVIVNIEKADGQNVVTNAFATAINSSEYYYDFTPSVAGQYTVMFNGIMPDTSQILVNQNLYVSDAESDYRPTVTLKADETIIFAADLDPLYIDPEELLSFFPDASLLEIGELIHHYSLEVKEIFNLLDTENGTGINFTTAEYIKASACCELSRTYGFGGDDELSLKLADLSITNRSNPRTSINRGNATTWCQIAAALRKELMASRVGMRAVTPKGLPSEKIATAGKNVDPETGAIIYLSDRELYGRGKKKSPKEDPMPSRGLKKYD